MLAFIAPYFAAGHPADRIALGLTLIAALRFPMPVTVAIGVLTTAILRHYLG